MSYTDGEGGNVPFRLMDRIKPHWRKLAIALQFPQHIIKVMESEADQVFYLFSEWLRGANQEHDTRPLTWRTLITALREANIQEEANILEKYLMTEPAQEAGSQSGTFVCYAFVYVPAQTRTPDSTRTVQTNASNWTKQNH